MGSSTSAKKWIAKSRQEAGEILGIGPRQITEYCSRGCPGRAKHYPIPEMIAWCKENIWNRHLSIDDAESIMGEEHAGSAWLEKFREERTKLARMERQEREGNLIPREKVHEGLIICAEILHRGLEHIQEDHPEAAQLLQESLDELEQTYRDRFGDPR